MVATEKKEEWKVGSIVRLQQQPNNVKVTRKAMIATLSLQDGTNEPSECSLLWEPITPKPLFSLFRIAPNISSSNTNNEEEEEEITVKTNQLKLLFPFETTTESSSSSTPISTRKDQGDRLLRCGDAATAVAYYEEALRLSSQPSIGASVVIQVDGFPKIAEIDYIDDHDDHDNDDDNNDGTMDITILEDSAESTIAISSVLLCLLQSDPERMQERILLNLARCMLQLADLDKTKYRTKYLKSTILACSLAITVSNFWATTSGTASTTSTTISTALLLRAKAFGFLSKWPHAMADAKRLIQQEEEEQGNKEGKQQQQKQQQGRKLLESLQKRKKYQIKTDKKLAKAVAKLVHSATTESEDLLVSTDDNNKEQRHPRKDPSPSLLLKKSTATTTTTTTTTTTSKSQISASFLFLTFGGVLVAAILIQRIMIMSTDHD